MVTSIELTSNSPVQASSPLRSTNTIGNPQLDTQLMLDQIEIGKSMPAQVLGKQKDGSFLIKLFIDNQKTAMLQMQLPSNYQTGDRLQLILQSTGGERPSFVLQNLNPFADQVNISSSAQILEHVLLQHPQSERVQGTQTLITAGTPQPDHLANELHHTLENSGVFYEAHLKQWHDGQRSLEQILQEPQNHSLDDIKQWLPLQLDSLENKQFAWQGEVWPNQTMQWDVCEDQSARSNTPNADPNEDKSWQTSIKMHLPNLGLVTANIRLLGDQVGLQLQTTQLGSAQLLSTASPLLLDALQSTGSQIESFKIVNDVATGSQ